MSYAKVWNIDCTAPSATANPVGNMCDWISNSFPVIDRVWTAIPRLRALGVSQSLIDELAAWAPTLWPNSDWSLAANATGDPPTSSGYVECSQ